jgi:hypothetical protein
MSLLICVGFVFKKVFVEKGKRRWFGVPKGVLPWKVEIGIKEMANWVTLPRDFTKKIVLKKRDKEMLSIMFLNMLY